MTGEIGWAWLEHDFDIPTRAKAAGQYRLLIVNGHTVSKKTDFQKGKFCLWVGIMAQKTKVNPWEFVVTKVDI